MKINPTGIDLRRSELAKVGQTPADSGKKQGAGAASASAAPRGDQVQISNMAFAHIDAAIGTPAPVPLLGLDSSDWFKIIEVAILSVTALLIGFFVARPLISRMFAPAGILPGTTVFAGQGVAGALPPPSEGGAPGMQPALVAATGGALPPPRENMIDISRIEGQVKESSIRKVGEVVQAHPEEALAILRTWLHQPG